MRNRRLPNYTPCSSLSLSLLATLILPLSSQPAARAAAAASLSTRQYQDNGYSACAKTCFEPAVDAANCPFDASGTRNACLCRDTSFLTDFMTCTFRSCGGEVLAQTAQMAVGNCDGTNTPSVWDVDKLLSVGQGEAASAASSSSSVAESPSTVSANPVVPSTAALTASSTFVTISPATSAASSSTPASVQPSSIPTTSPNSPSATPTPTASNTPSSPSSPSSGSSPPSGLNTAAIIGIVIAIVGLVSALIFGIHQWRTRPPGDRVVRDVGSWFCGCGRHRNYNEAPMVLNPRRNNGYR